MELFRVLQGQGFSRRNVMQAIKDRTIFVDNQIVQEFGCEVIGGEQITGTIKNLPISLFVPQDEQKITTILFYKPVGYVTSVSDPDWPTIYEILPEQYRHLRYAGRLDRESEGLLVLSNDRQLINHLTHPRYEHEKLYLVQVDRGFEENDIETMMEGLSIDNWGNIRDNEHSELLKCKNVKRKDFDLIEITLDYGKKRHIRRLLKALGYHVVMLKRLQQGEYTLGNLKSGQLVELES